MGKKAGKFKKKENNNAPKKAKRDFYNEDDDMMNDAIDAFHEQRDMIPLNVNEDDAESDEDNEHPVYDLKEDEDEEDEDDDLDDAELTGLGAKIARTQKYLRATMGGVEDEMHDEAEEEKEERPLWGRGKNIYYYQDKQGPEQESSDEDLIAEEEAEVLRLQQKKAKSLSAEDFGLEDDEEELTLEEILAQGKSGLAVSADGEAKNETGTAYEEVQKDLNALTKEEQMDVVYSSAPELVGLLSELSEALEQLDNKVNPILNKMKELDGNLPSELEDFLHKNVDNVTGVKLAGSNLDSEPLPISHKPSVALADVQETEPHEAELVEANGLKSQQKNESKRKRQDDQVGIQSREMLKVRADLEEKWKQTGVLSSIARKHEKQNKRLRLLNGQLATPDDFDDDAMVAGDDREIRSLNKLSRLVTPQVARPKVISGDDDLPKRDDIGERRRKHELRVLAGAGVEPSDDVEDEPGNHASDDDVASSDDGEMDSDLEFYKEVEKQHSAKLVAKEKMYSSRAPVISSTTETLVDGKRQINYQMEKNRGLTRHRNKLTKNPRKKYRGKHEKQQKRRKGQVRDIKKPSGPYGGETTGINAASRRSIRL
ncbi:protein THALLO isoform X3 [Nicotiana tomentosiformis]|uniref:protein THALLO isoform X3 n=1 Tax=Nicotiana tomentosiformis TaxID=4098 RepID=UPI00388C48D4